MVVFTARFVINYLGWVGDEKTVTEPVDESPANHLTQINPPHSLSQAELEQAQKVAERFLARYLNKDYGHLSGWVEKMRPDVTAEFYQHLKMESETTRDTIDVQKSNFKKKERSHCIEEQGSKVSCMVEAVYQVVTEKQQSQLWSDSFEIRLAKQGTGWKVEELNIHGSLD
jgi:hypothetical protein